MRGGVVIDVGVGKKTEDRVTSSRMPQGLEARAEQRCALFSVGPVAGIYGIYEHREVLASIPSAEVSPNCGSI